MNFEKFNKFCFVKWITNACRCQEANNPLFRNSYNPLSIFLTMQTCHISKPCIKVISNFSHYSMHVAQYHQFMHVSHKLLLPQKEKSQVTLFIRFCIFMDTICVGRLKHTHVVHHSLFVRNNVLLTVNKKSFFLDLSYVLLFFKLIFAFHQI